MDEIEITDLREAASRIRSVDQYKHWIRHEVRQVLPHGAFACGHGRVHSAGVSMDYVLTVDYPVGYLAAIRNAAGGIDTPLMRRWFQTRKPVIYDPGAAEFEVDDAWRENFRQHGLINAIAHAEYDLARCIGTYFSFHQLAQPLGQVQRAILAGITPVLHETLLNVIAEVERTRGSRPAAVTVQNPPVAGSPASAGPAGRAGGHPPHIASIVQKACCAGSAESAACLVAGDPRSGHRTIVL
jgi:hypothetical protein